MGQNLSRSVSNDLPEASKEDYERLKGQGYVPCVAVCSLDIQGNNNLKTVYIAEYEHGAEITLLFLDEDRLNVCLDCVYDTVRRLLFGRSCDIESILIFKEDDGSKTVCFPGTYSGEQNWRIRNPSHNRAEVKLSEFEEKEDEFVLWVNTWNHLMGEKNTNPEFSDIVYCTRGTNSDQIFSDYVLRQGSRAEVDARFKGLMTSVVEIMTPEREKKLGKRLF
jgi:hypothetical protein